MRSIQFHQYHIWGFLRNLGSDMSTLIQVMAWCHIMAPRHYPNQDWIRFMMAYLTSWHDMTMGLLLWTGADNSTLIKWYIGGSFVGIAIPLHKLIDSLSVLSQYLSYTLVDRWYSKCFILKKSWLFCMNSEKRVGIIILFTKCCKLRAR